MPLHPSEDMIGREVEWKRLAEFATSGDPSASLGIVWGRRRVGKSFMLQDLAEQARGFYYHAVRGSSAEALRDLGERLGVQQGAVAPLSLGSWDEAIDALMALGRERELAVVLDEFPYLLEHTPALDSIVQRAYGARAETRLGSQTRLVLCGSAMSVMGKLLSGTAPLRGRAGLDLRVQPFDFRTARQLHDIDDLATAVEVYAVIGGVAAYAREMVANDLPAGPDDFDRWICRRVLSPGAPLFGEVDLLLGDDPAVSKVRKPNLYHATLAGVALGHHAWSSLTSYVKISGSSLHSIVSALVSAEFIAEVEDPVRDNRPTYEPADPLIRFHYSVIRRHRARLGRHAVDTAALWRELSVTFLAEAQMRELHRRYLGIDRPTDVLAFDLGEGEELLGDVYVAPEVAARNALEHGVPAEEEVLRVVVHGVLHALGHDHPAGESRYESEMFRLQESVVQRLRR